MWVKSVRSDLFEALQLVTKAVSTRSTLPILSGLYLEARNEEVILYGTDLEITIIAKFKSNIIEEGKAVIPAKLLLDIVRNLPEGVIEIKQGGIGTQVEISCEKNFFTLNTFNVEDFPKMPELKEKEKLTLESQALRNSLEKVVKSASKDETRPVLTGVLLEGMKNGLRMVATDSYRLSLTELESKENFEGVEVITPSRILEEMSKSLGKFEGEVQIYPGESEIAFKVDGLPKAGETTFLSRLIEGQFPKYSQLIPSEFESEIYAPREELLLALKRISVFTSSNPIKMEFASQSGKELLKLSTGSSELGSAYSEVEVSLKGKKGEIAFNPGFLLDGVEKIPGDKVFIGVQSATKPALFKPVEDGDRSEGFGKYLYLLMPVRIS